ncbi:hypothetical protein [Alicyclobacillus suci]|nr:hypothetical protein [Alicyclobacillus suci]
MNGYTILTIVGCVMMAACGICGYIVGSWNERRSIIERGREDAK